MADNPIGTIIGNETCAEQDSAAATFMQGLPANYKRLPLATQKAFMADLALLMARIAGKKIAKHALVWETVTVAPTSGDGLDRPIPSVCQQFDSGGNHVALWLKVGDGAKQWMSLGGWDSITFDPSVVGYDRPPPTVVWQVNPTDPTDIQALWAKYGSTNTQWSKIWASPLISSPWETLLDLDLAAQGNISLSSDGAHTIDGKSWTKENSSGDQSAMAIVSGTGLVIQPKNTTNYDAGTRTAPMLSIPLSSLSGSLHMWSSLRAWIYLSAENAAANYDHAGVGVDAGNMSWMWAAFRGYFNGGRVYVAHTINNVTLAGVRNNTTLDDSNKVLAVQIDKLGGYVAKVLMGAYSSGWPAVGNTVAAATVADTVENASDYVPDSPNDLRLVLTALRAGSGTALSVTIARVKVEVRYDGSLAGSSAPATALATAGAPVDIGSANPPMPGQILKAIGVNQLEFADEKGADEAYTAVTIVGGVISGFGLARNLLVSGTGPLVGIAPTDVASVLKLTFVTDTVVSAMGSPPGGAAPIKTPRMGDTNPQDIHALADDVVVVQLRTGVATPFWKVIGGGYT